MMTEWYDKLALSGLALAFIGWMMFIIGLSYAMSANRQARAELRSSIQQAHTELQKLP